MKKRKHTLVVYEYPAANYDILHWIERFKANITTLTRLDNKKGYQYLISIKNGTYEETLDAVPFALLNHYRKHLSVSFDKLVVVGRIPLENKEIMNS
jgi:hypothetical protein